MNTFIKKISVRNEGILEFYFCAQHSPHEQKYFITVVDSSMKPNLFYMIHQEGSWRILQAEKLPRWIAKLEYELSLAIISQ